MPHITYLLMNNAETCLWYMHWALPGRYYDLEDVCVLRFSYCFSYLLLRVAGADESSQWLFPQKPVLCYSKKNIITKNRIGCMYFLLLIPILLVFLY